MLHKARIIKAVEASTASSTLPEEPQTKNAARLIPRVVVDAHAAAAEIKRAANAEAAAQLNGISAEKARVLSGAREEGFAQGIAEATAACVALTKLEATKDARELDRSVQLARLLAERLLGQALQTNEAIVTQLAAQALSEVRGATRIRMEVSPIDKPVLSASLQELDIPGAALKLSVDPTLGSGDFRIQTNVGSLDAKLGTRLEILCQKLREGLRT